ncbi:MAG: peptidase, partial [Clostridia bacterium]|nr:peptidase [Clostridia bacterium]
MELKNIIPPEEIQSAMEKQIKAERDRRETLLQADGLKALKEAGVDAAVLELKKYEALVNLSNGTASKLIIPT